MRRNASLSCLALILAGAVSLFGTPPVFEARDVLEVQAGGEAITVGDVNGDGEADIVTASDNLITLTSQLNIFYGNAEGTYRAGAVLPLPSDFDPRGVAIGDFNRDGLPDIAAVGDRKLVLFLQQPSGSFVTTPLPFQFEANSYTVDIVAADINGDGLVDLILPTGNGTAVFLNIGNAQFQGPTYVNSVPGNFVAVADLNDDKNLDLITVGGTETAQLFVQLGNGNGTFHTPASQPTVAGYVQPEIAVADFNGDGILDVALTAAPEPFTATVYLLNGNGDGTFSAGYSSTLPSGTPYSSGLASADVNRDGLPDLLVAGATGYVGNLLFLENAGKGIFAEPVAYAAQANAFSVAAVTQPAGQASGAIVVPDDGSFDTVFRANSGGFVVPKTYGATNAPASVLAGDFNNDGKLDLVGFTASGIVTYINTGIDKKLFAALPAHPFKGGIYGVALAVGDFNGDGRLDLAAAYNPESDGGVAVAAAFLGNGNGTFSSPATGSYVGSNPVLGLAAADLNGDGKLDLITNFLTVAPGNGDGTFAPASSRKYSCTGDSTPLIADFNLDGKLDVLTVCNVDESPEVAIYLGNGDGTFQSTPVYKQSVGYLVSFNIGDFNGDGIPDFVLINEPDEGLPQLTVMFGAGNGTFTKGPIVNLPTLVVNTAVPGDYNGDGIIDLALVDIDDSVVSVLAGNGDGTFQAPQSFGVVASPSCMVSGEFRAAAKAGYNDLVVCTPAGLEVLQNTTK